MKSKGFTLIELVVVIVILGILAAVGIPKYVDMTSQAKKAHDDAQLNALRSCTKLLYAKNALDGTASWPTKAEVINNMANYSGLWQYYTTVTYTSRDGVWTATSTAERERLDDIGEITFPPDDGRRREG